MLLGGETAAVYPTLLAATSDVAHPGWQARAVGVYRRWRDSGSTAVALLALDRRRPHRRLRTAHLGTDI